MPEPIGDGGISGLASQTGATSLLGRATLLPGESVTGYHLGLDRMLEEFKTQSPLAEMQVGEMYDAFLWVGR